MSVTLDDCRVETFRSGGPGGQHQNKVASGVRITHPPSGAVGQSRDDRSQHTNKRIAFKRMVQSQLFQSWMKRRIAWVEQQTTPDKLKVENL